MPCRLFPLTNADVLPMPNADETVVRRPRVAAVVTAFYHRSHAHAILENFLEPYLFCGRRVDSPCEVVSLYVDQFPHNDMARAVARQYNLPLYDTIAGALCLGTNSLAVDAVLSIAEHGNYPVNSLGQTEYPRKRFFDEIAAVALRAGRVLPVFNDKHLSYRWDWASEMYATARRLKMPLMAGSSVPLAERRPPLNLSPDPPMVEAVAVHGGEIEAYDFHALEILQSIAEGRRGGESGIASVQFLRGDALWQAAAKGAWSEQLAAAALRTELGQAVDALPLRALAESLRIREAQQAPNREATPHGILLTYRDGFRGMVLRLGNSDTRWSLACRVADDDMLHATSFHVGPWENRNLFKALSHAIQDFFVTQTEPYPSQRTLLTTGVLAAAMESRLQGDQEILTPELNISYASRDFRRFVEDGGTWKIITPDVPEPTGISPLGTARLPVRYN